MSHPQTLISQIDLYYPPDAPSPPNKPQRVVLEIE